MSGARARTTTANFASSLRSLGANNRDLPAAANGAMRLFSIDFFSLVQ